MAATAEQIARVRRYTDEPAATSSYMDTDIQVYIERYPVIDGLGVPPFYYDYSTTPPTKTARTDWIASYDLHAAAAEIWQEKAAALAPNYIFSADGASYNRSEAYDHAMQRSAYHESKRPPRDVKFRPEPRTVTVDLGQITNPDAL